MSFAYGSMDGTSFCGQRYWSVHDQPYWIDVSGDQLILTSNNLFDKTTTKELNVKVQPGNSFWVYTQKYPVIFSLTCPSDQTCTDEKSIRSPLESDVPDVSPTELNCVEGDVLDNEEEIMWYVPK